MRLRFLFPVLIGLAIFGCNKPKKFSSLSDDQKALLGKLSFAATSRALDRHTPIDDGRNMVNSYHEFINGSVYRKDASSGGYIQYKVQDIIHGVCKNCDSSQAYYPSYFVKKTTLDSIMSQKGVEYVQLYPALRPDPDKPDQLVLTLVLTGANREKVRVPQQMRNSAGVLEDMVWEYIDPCIPRCPLF